MVKKNRKCVNKKGQIGQIVLFMAVILGLSITIIVGKVILTEFYSAINQANLNTTTSTAAQAIMESQYQTFDYAMIIFSVVLIIGLLITSFMIPSHPIFLVLNIIGIVILVFTGFVMNNIYAEMVSGEGADYLGAAADNFSLINNLIMMLPYFGAVAVFLTSVIMFTRGM